MFVLRVERIKINPFSVLSGTLLLLAPFGAWMTLFAFGYVSGSNLWQISRSQTSFPIGQSLPAVALYTSILLEIAGVCMLARSKIGIVLAAGSVSLFSVESYSSFGTFPGTIQVSILPGIGFFLAISGALLGLGALRVGTMTIANIVDILKTRVGFGFAGIVAASISLAADGWSHWSTGEFSDFLGTSLFEGAIHRVFFIGVALLLIVFLVQRTLFPQKLGGVLVVATFGSLILDAIYHFSTGSIIDFVGHDSSEILLHGLTYYGAVALVAARFVVRR